MPVTSDAPQTATLAASDHPPQYVFGYGSLMHPASAARTLGRKLASREMIPLHLPNWIRVWQATSSRFVLTEDGEKAPMVFLDVVPEDGITLNGIAFPVTPAELKAVDAREELYDRIDINRLLPRPALHGPVWMYVCRPENSTPPSHAIILAEYEELVYKSLDLHGPQFRADYEGSTRYSPIRRLSGGERVRERYRV